MSGYLEAKEDGIKIVKTGSRGEFTHYIVKCNECGEDFKTSKYERNKKYICKKCKRAEKKTFSAIRADRMFQNAMAAFRKMFVFKKSEDIKEYDNAIAKVKQMVDNGIRFDSKEEMLVAIELFKNDIPFELHKKVCGYELDFFLPDENLNIEVDGVLYHWGKTHEDLKRDIELSKEIGEDFKTVRILDSSIVHSVIGLMCIIHDALIENTLFGNYITDEEYFIRCAEYRYDGLK